MGDNRKDKKIVLFLIIFLIIILAITYFVYSYYVKNIPTDILKNELLSAVSNNDISFFIKEDLYSNIYKKIESQDYETSNDLTLATTMTNNMFSDLDLSKIQISYDMVKSNSENKTYHKLTTKYAGNDFITFDFIKNDSQVAVKSDEIVNRYVGVSDKNFQSIINKIKGTNVDLSDFKKAKNFIVDRENIDILKLKNTNNLKSYANFIKDEILSENISKKENVIVTMNGQQINTSEYTVTLDSTQFNRLLKNISNQIEKDDEILSELVVSNVQDLEDDNTILEYNDNDSILEIQANEINYNTSVTIYDENTTNQTSINQLETNTILEQTNTVSENSTVENTTVQNTVVEETTSENTVANNTGANNTVANNTVTNNTVLENTTNQNTITNETVLDNINSVEQQEVTQAIQNAVQTQNVVTIQDPTIQEPATEIIEINTEQQPEPATEIIEEDNFRTQGYITVNEESEGIVQDQNFIIGENYEETLENFTELIEKLNWKYYLLTGAKANITREELLEEIQKSISKIVKQNNSIITKFYVSEGKLVKINFEIVETSEVLDIEIASVGENEKYLNFKIIKGKENLLNGYSISLYKKISDTVLTNKININKINKNKITQKTKINIQTKGTTNSKKYITNIVVAYSDSDGEFKIDLDNVLNFDINAQIQDLTDENCLFLDILSEDDLLANVNAIKEKTINVLKAKNRSLNIIDLNNSNLIVKQTENNETEQENFEGKEEAKQALIQTVSIKMRQYLDAGTNLTIQDLEGLEIPGFEVNISISSNLAIITVNGYRFKIDSDFNLSDS